jgi:nucleotide-binding universal stress UspA family protein
MRFISRRESTRHATAARVHNTPGREHLAARGRPTQRLRVRCGKVVAPAVQDRGQEVPVSENRPVQVVVAYDISPSGEVALARAIEVAARAPQHVLHVVLVLESYASGSKTTYDQADDVHQLILDHVQNAFAGKPTASEVQFYVHVRIGKPADTILDVALEVGADLIFIGSHNKVGLDRFLLGSVSERVVREARCPVMVVRPRTYEDVDLVRVFQYDHERAPWKPPHRYSYVETRVIARPPDWPLN